MGKVEAPLSLAPAAALSHIAFPNLHNTNMKITPTPTQITCFRGPNARTLSQFKSINAVILELERTISTLDYNEPVIRTVKTGTCSSLSPLSVIIKCASNDPSYVNVLFLPKICNNGPPETMKKIYIVCPLTLIICHYYLRILKYIEAFMYLMQSFHCLLYTSPSPRDRQKSRMPSSA